MLKFGSRAIRIAVIFCLGSMTACISRTEAPTDGNFELGEAHEIMGFGFRIEYPLGWQAETQDTVTIISQFEEDHQRASRGAYAEKGYLVGLDHRDITFMSGLGLPDDPRLTDLLEFNSAFFEWQEPTEVTETEIFGVPALSVKASNEEVWGIYIIGFRVDEAFLLSVTHPSEAGLDAFTSTWNGMLESIRPVAR